jgi:hypothetical protein
LAGKKSVVYTASLVIAGEFEPNEVSQAVGLIPSDVWRPGDPTVPGALLIHKQAGWRLKAVERAEDKSLDDVVERLLGTLDASKDRITSLPVAHERFIDCVVVSPGRDAVLTLSQSSIQAIAWLGCRLDIDYFQVPESEE